MSEPEATLPGGPKPVRRWGRIEVLSGVVPLMAVVAVGVWPSIERARDTADRMH